MHDAKPFEPTPSRIARAKREGDLPRSAELTGALALAGACAVLPLVTATASGAAQTAFVDAAHGAATAAPYAVIAVLALLPCVAGGVGALIGSGFLAGGLVLAPLRFDLQKLQPAAGLRRVFSMRSAGAGARALAAACIAGAALVPLVRNALVPGGAGTAPTAIVAATLDATRRVLGTAVVLGLALGIVDALLERAAWRRRLRMSVAEMKQDLKQSEGDPELRGRRRTQHRAVIRGSLARLPNATFVVANPSHVAIALEYRPPVVAVPRVLIRAIDEGARLVKKRASNLGIPVIEDVALARTLLTTTRVDEAIPRGCYLAVARIVAYLQSREAPQ